MSIKKEAISNEKSYKLALKKVDDLMKLGSQKITFDQAKEITTLAKSIQTYEKNLYTITPPTTLAGMIELKMYEMKLKQVELAKLFGEPEVLKGYGRRNTTLNAVAPTTSSAFILGQVSQGIEPIWSNSYVKDIAKIKTTIKNPYLLELLEKFGIKSVPTYVLIEDGLEVKRMNGAKTREQFLEFVNG